MVWVGRDPKDHLISTPLCHVSKVSKLSFETLLHVLGLICTLKGTINYLSGFSVNLALTQLLLWVDKQWGGCWSVSGDDSNHLAVFY